MHTKTIGIALTTLALAVALPALAQTGSTTQPQTTTMSSTSKIACIGTAVAAREQTLGTAYTTFTTASAGAYSARASALSNAYSQTSLSSVKTEVKTAWITFSSSMKSVRKVWQGSRDGAWKKYRTSAVVCKASSGVGDGSHADSETSGN